MANVVSGRTQPLVKGASLLVIRDLEGGFLWCCGGLVGQVGGLGVVSVKYQVVP